MYFMDFENFLEQRLRQELPAHNAHLKMAPVIDGKPFRKFKPDYNAKNSAVLIPLIRDGNNLRILFTLRSNKLKNHSGQISFPGGRADLGETPEMTALREAKEEVGIPYANVKILGRLSSLFVPPSNSVITPVVGLISNDYSIVLSEDEVEEVFEIDFDSFFDSSNYKKEVWDFDGIKVDVPFWNIHHTVPLWGATAMILNELVELGQEYKSRIV
jgi:8-oxo-dGTP pyrophosphatase MutT (NUDIX family)